MVLGRGSCAGGVLRGLVSSPPRAAASVDPRPRSRPRARRSRPARGGAGRWSDPAPPDAFRGGGPDAGAAVPRRPAGGRARRVRGLLGGDVLPRAGPRGRAAPDRSVCGRERRGAATGLVLDPDRRPSDGVARRLARRPEGPLAHRPQSGRRSALDRRPRRPGVHRRRPQPRGLPGGLGSLERTMWSPVAPWRSTTHAWAEPPAAADPDPPRWSMGCSGDRGSPRAGCLPTRSTRWSSCGGRYGPLVRQRL